jgi:predicted DNA binding CopG/RHH family protein
MTKEKSIRVRLSDEDFERLKKYATKKDVPMSQIIRDYIRKLPKE